jgi:uncharacterized RDD family membrane protein YckC
VVRGVSLPVSPFKRRQAAPRIRMAVTVVAAALAAVATAAAGYGPSVPPGSPVPGGFSTVIASKTFGPNGGTLTARIGKTGFELHIQHGALRSRIQFTLTAPRLRNLGAHVPHGTVATTGVALLATYPNGHFVVGPLGKSGVRLTVVDRRITKHSIVLVWNQRTRRFTRLRATIAAGRAGFTLNRIQEILIASPK